MRNKYDWSILQKQGDWLVVEDLEPVKIRTTVNAYVKRHLPYGSVVVTREIKEGTFVALARVPEDEQSIKEQMRDENLQLKENLFGPEIDPDEEIRQYLDD